MRRSLLPLFVVVLVIGVTMLPWGTQSSDRLVHLVIDGEPVQSRVPARLAGSRTMVPVRLISERLGADVQWLPDTRQVRVTAGNTVILLTIDDTAVRVGEATHQLPAAPFIEDGTTLVPLRFVSETLGADVEWDGDTYTVYITSPEPVSVTDPDPHPNSPHRLVSVRHVAVGGASGLELKTEGMAPLEILPLDQGTRPYPRMLLRLSGTVVALDTPGFTLGGILLRGGATEVGGDPPVTEVLVELLEETTYTVLPAEWDPETGTQTVTIQMRDWVRDVIYRSSPGGPWIDIITTAPPDFTAFRLAEPDRLVIDIPGMVPASRVAGLAVGVDEPPVTEIRAALFEASPPVTRVVIDSGYALTYDIETVANGLRVHLHGLLQSVSAGRDGAGLSLSVSATARPAAHVSYDAGTRTLIVDLPRIRYNGNASLDYSTDHMLQSLKVSEVPVNAGSGQKVLGTRISVELTHYGGHTLTATSDGLVLKVAGSPVAGKKIVIDPGHGGRDPGAIGPRGTQEKVMTLDVAGRLRRMLEEAGAAVTMTRYGDENPGLYERVAVANNLGADLIISVHFNGDTRPTTRGTETFYYDNHPHSRRLAEIMHRALLEELGRADRQIRYRREFVLLREPKMPSVLVEPLYITNPDEELLIRDPDYRERVARALYSAILEFFGGH